MSPLRIAAQNLDFYRVHDWYTKYGTIDLYRDEYDPYQPDNFLSTYRQTECVDIDPADARIIEALRHGVRLWLLDPELYRRHARRVEPVSATNYHLQPHRARR